MLHTLYSKLAAVLLGLFLLVGAVATLGTLRVVDLFNKEARQTLSRNLARHLAEQNRIVNQTALDTVALRNMFDMQRMVNPIIETYLIDREGQLLAYSSGGKPVVRKRIAIEPIRRFLTAQPGFPIYGDDPRDADTGRIFSVTPLPGVGEPRAYLYVTLAGDEQVTMKSLWRDSNVLKLGVGMGALILLAGLAAGLILFATMTRRLERLARAMDEFKRADFSIRPVIASRERVAQGDEIDRLTANFRDLANRTAAQFNTLKKNDVLRRELVANVSHDLKTPLATMQGYVDTLLLKDDRLSQQERLNYLQIASRSCERLSKLVADLIELAKLDAREVSLHLEDFSAAELLQDVAQKFQLQAEQRRIRLDCDFPDRTPYVHADIGLIERVLENLIGNALAHTDSGGVVRLVLRASVSTVSLEVADTGVGIAADDLPFVFDRFYRTAKGARGGSENAGLGLAITKSILDLHASSMSVRSEIGMGTTFGFALPVAGSAET